MNGGATITSTQLYGRKKLLVSSSKGELTANHIANILKDILPIHRKNTSEIMALRTEFRGNQDIYKKVKVIRSTINNKVAENHLRHAVSFKKSYGFGDPIQYVTKIHEGDDIPLSKGDEPNVTKELSILNTMFANTSKSSLDIDLAEEIYVAGVCPRFLKVTTDGFELHNLDPTKSAVVYSTDIGNERLFSFYLTSKKDYVKDEVNLFVTVHTDTHKYTFTTPESNYVDGMELPPTYVKLSIEEEANVLNHIPIYEYVFNKDRVSIVEIMLPSQKALNSITSNELDDIEQFVEQLLVFTNAEIDTEDASVLREQGIVQLKDSNNFKASVQILAEKMDNNSINVLYERIYEMMMVNAGVPLVNGDSGGGDTGLARLTNNGWLMADTKTKEDELSFIQCEKPLLQAIIDLLTRKNIITDLNTSHIDTKFTRNKADNILTKIQAIQSAVGILAPKDAFTLSGAFNDPEQAVKNAISYYGENFFKGDQSNEIENLNNEVVKKINEGPQEE